MISGADPQPPKRSPGRKVVIEKGGDDKECSKKYLKEEKIITESSLAKLETKEEVVEDRQS